MVRSVNHEERRRQVLGAVMEHYIKTALAVSSEDICRQFDCSSATIRTIMGELEEHGYITHVYTSSGRVPTDKGYRYYVDMLLSQMQLVQEEKEHLEKEYCRHKSKLEDILETTLEVLSTYTQCTGIVSLLRPQSKIYYNGASFITQYPELGDIEKMRTILKFLEEKKKLLDIINRDLEKKLNIYIGREMDCQEIENCSLVVSTYDFENKPYGRVSVLGPRNMDYSRIIPTIEYVSDLVSKALSEL